MHLIISFTLCFCLFVPASFAQTQYKRIDISGIETNGGIYDPAVEYNIDGTTGYLLYSAIHGEGNMPGPFISTHLAKSMDAGDTWSYVQTINSSFNETIDFFDGTKLKGRWRYEVPTLAYDPDDEGQEWKLFVHRYFSSDQKGDRLPAYGWIMMRTASDPEGNWSEEIRLFGTGKFPPPPYKVRVNLNDLHPDLKDSMAYSEPGALYKDGVLFLSLTSLGKKGPEFIFLLASNDHGQTWKYLGKLLDKKDANDLGYEKFDASSLAKVGDQFYLLASGEKDGIEHVGTCVFQFDNIAIAQLKKDEGKVKLIQYIEPQDGFKKSKQGSGQSTYHEANKAGGIIFSQFNSDDFPHVFQIFSSGIHINQK